MVFEPIPEDTHIGHVHLKVADLHRSLEFYHGVLGFTITQQIEDSAAFLSAGDYHHHIGINTWQRAGCAPPPPSSTGLYHMAIRYKTHIQLDGAADHGVSEALYIRDPDQNGVELYWDRPKSQWPRNSASSLVMVTEPLNIDDLLKELEISNLDHEQNI